MTRLSLLGCVTWLTLACSSGTPKNLVDARAAYQRAAQGPAAQLTPAQLHVAHSALTVAEKTYDDEGDSPNTRDRAYVAQRKAELAEVQAAIAANEQREAFAIRQAALHRTQNQLAMQQNLTQTQAQLAAEQQRRQDAERRTAEAMAQLSSIASIKKETRGTVITLSGAVIFASNKAELLPAARAKLDQVATALKQSEPNARFLVEGHTDSRGADDMNQELSARRAAAVRDYLVQQGVPSDRITSAGRGKTEPVADNNTAEGRANNRRVEIIVQSDGQQSESNQQQTNAGVQQGMSGSQTSQQAGSTTATGSQNEQQTSGTTQGQPGQSTQPGAPGTTGATGTGQGTVNRPTGPVGNTTTGQESPNRAQPGTGTTGTTGQGQGTTNRPETGTTR
jgi:outer membrane protein OmpA-like peptidoglycan-associated protein